jgi:glutaredoxin 3
MNFLGFAFLLAAATIPLFSSSEGQQIAIKSEKPHLLLIYSPKCPYCRKVLNYLEKQHKSIPLCNVLEQRACINKLYDLGEQRIVPCLLIDKTALFDAQAIIAWLQENESLL